MPTITSEDGTLIAYEQSGAGPAIVLIDGAMCHRAGGPMRPLAALLRERFTVYAYDRRGRGESSDTAPYAVDREVEDLRALIAAAGGTALLCAMSSGGALALRTAAADPGVAGVALYEPPFLHGSPEYSAKLRELLGAGRNGDAVARFMAYVGIPGPVVAGMRSGPGFAALEAIAPTLAYDDELLGDGEVPKDLEITAPMLVISGGASPESLRAAARAVADAFATAGHLELDGETHDVRPEALAPALEEFFAKA
ncbi:alpha/beta hydrolase [Actinoplanes sp. NPDC026623]|uniref:alpha/beta fold hydrolase n=1 Tax=Actinoplanes sp. NPDC026623 TaxID=3155610 RepID=UPI0033DA0F92